MKKASAIVKSIGSKSNLDEQSCNSVENIKKQEADDLSEERKSELLTEPTLEMANKKKTM